MLKFAVKNMAVKKAQILLVVLSIMLSAGVAVLAYNTAQQVSDGITGTAGYYSVIVGPAGSKTQLVMNTLYFTDSPLGTLPYSLLSQLKSDMRVNSAQPFAMADSYNGYSVAGITAAFLDGKEVAQGGMFIDGEAFQAVLGANVAAACRVKVGDAIYTSHSAGETHSHPLTVTGILAPTHTVYDQMVFTQIRTIWEVHEHEEEEHDEHEEDEHHDHADMDGMVCAILVRTKNPAYAMTLANEYNGKIYTAPDGTPYSLQAVEPMEAVRGLLEETNNTKYIVFVLCGIILLMNIVIISVITLLNMVHAAKEIALMRLIGISMKKINLLYVVQNLLIGLASTLLAFGLSRLCLTFMGDYVASMGVVLDIGRVYPLEIVILLAVLLISVLPTLICTAVMAKKDGIGA